MASSVLLHAILLLCLCPATPAVRIDIEEDFFDKEAQAETTAAEERHADGGAALEKMQEQDEERRGQDEEEDEEVQEQDEEEEDDEEREAARQEMCECIANCGEEVWKEKPSCDDGMIRHEEAKEAGSDGKWQCKAMKCTLSCAKATENLADDLKAACGLLKAEHPDCDVDCNGGQDARDAVEEEEENVESKSRESPNGTALVETGRPRWCPRNGRWDTCTPECRCPEGWGDCDSNAGCKRGLYCRQGSGKDQCVRRGGGGHGGGRGGGRRGGHMGGGHHGGHWGGQHGGHNGGHGGGHHGGNWGGQHGGHMGGHGGGFHGGHHGGHMGGHMGGPGDWDGDGIHDSQQGGCNRGCVRCPWGTADGGTCQPPGKCGNDGFFGEMMSLVDHC